VGAVGAKLLYPDRTLQHAGVVLGLGVASHAFKHLPDDEPSYACLAHAVRDVSAVTGACMMIRRELFERIGGFDERLPVAFNDVDICLRLRAAGYLVVYTPFAALFHHESATRGSLHPPQDEALMRERWRAALALDPYYSPHLTREREDYGLRT
jgi:O-antigen biosynthesis protein